MCVCTYLSICIYSYAYMHQIHIPVLSTARWRNSFSDVCTEASSIGNTTSTSREVCDCFIRLLRQGAWYITPLRVELSRFLHQVEFRGRTVGSNSRLIELHPFVLTPLVRSPSSALHKAFFMYLFMQSSQWFFVSLAVLARRISEPAAARRESLQNADFKGRT